MQATLKPLQSQYKSTEVVLEDRVLGISVTVSVCDDEQWMENLDYPSDREVTKWGYETLDEAVADDMIDTIMDSDYEKQKNYLFAKKLMEIVNGSNQE
jgi:hypothetical protein